MISCSGYLAQLFWFRSCYHRSIGRNSAGLHCTSMIILCDVQTKRFRVETVCITRIQFPPDTAWAHSELEHKKRSIKFDHVDVDNGVDWVRDIKSLGAAWKKWGGVETSWGIDTLANQSVYTHERATMAEHLFQYYRDSREYTQHQENSSSSSPTQYYLNSIRRAYSSSPGPSSCTLSRDWTRTEGSSWFKLPGRIRWLQDGYQVCFADQHWHTAFLITCFFPISILHFLGVILLQHI